MYSAPKIFFLMASVLLVLNACQKEVDSTPLDETKLLGYWINPQPIDTLWQFQKSLIIPQSTYGVSFGQKSHFVERTNVGWCGTPPITMQNYLGTWFLTDSVVNISVVRWNGYASFQWKVIKVTEGKLLVYKINNTLDLTD